MKRSMDGTPKFIEINPRLGGSSYFATLAGVNFLEIILKIVDGQAYKVSQPEQVTILRYHNEVVVWKKM